ncbi:MAG: hypothetical protein AB8B87_22485 [Granulosicoccus sp.]
MSQGICAVCLQLSNLQDSHYIPKGVFKTTGNAGEEYESQLVHINIKTGTASYSNFRPTQKLLCSNCEQRFSDRGENLVIPDLRIHSKFPLHDDILAAVPNDASVTPLNMGKLNVQAYAYFALSVI